jgi:hypothetical protein
MILWGLKTEAAFDVWSIEHLIMGINLGGFISFALKRCNMPETVPKILQTKISFLLVLMVTLLWENLEHYIELGLLGQGIAFWFQGVEHWTNRLIFDNMMVITGWFIYVKKNKTVWFARIFSCVWLMFHIVIFPHSMYLHELFEK